MDQIISKYTFEELDELNICYDNGLAYQRDMSKSVDYDVDYFEKYIKYEDTDIAIEINNCRTSITQEYVSTLLDIGIGSGEFIKKSNIKVFGFDINPYGVNWLKERSLYVNPYEFMPEDIQGVSLWDTLEHIPNPQDLWSVIRQKQYVFISIPIFLSLTDIKNNKHYRPNEHYYYFTKAGLISYMKDSGFSYLVSNDGESQAGREGILTFVFLKD